MKLIIKTLAIIALNAGTLTTLFAQDETVNGNLTVTGSASTQKLAIGTTSSFNTFGGRKWWTNPSEYNYTEFTETGWGGAAGLLFNCYSTSESGGLDNAGNIKYATNPGSFSSGAGLIKYLGNGGVLSFRLSPTSSGAGNSVSWNNVMDLTRDQQAIFYGNVSIGSSAAGYKLSVGGNMIAESVKVKLVANWPDYVFSTKHQLRSLGDLEKYIQINKHLPEIPSAEEVKKDGIELGEMNAKLLKKIEELTLYVIEQDKKLESYGKEIELLKKIIRP